MIFYDSNTSVSNMNINMFLVLTIWLKSSSPLIEIFSLNMKTKIVRGTVFVLQIITPTHKIILLSSFLIDKD